MMMCDRWRLVYSVHTEYGRAQDGRFYFLKWIMNEWITQSIFFCILHACLLQHTLHTCYCTTLNWNLSVRLIDSIVVWYPSDLPTVQERPLPSLWIVWNTTNLWNDPHGTSHYKVGRTVRTWSEVMSFVGWIQGINDTNNAALDRIHTIKRNSLLGDGRKEERKKKHKETLTTIDPRQIPIDRFLSLMNRLE